MIDIEVINTLVQHVIDKLSLLDTNNAIDGLFVFGLIMFQLATIRQLRKVHRTKQTQGISLTHYKWKLVALISMTTGYAVSCIYSSPLYLSLIVSILELSLNIALFYYVYKFRLLEWEQDRIAEGGPVND